MMQVKVSPWAALAKCQDNDTGHLAAHRAAGGPAGLSLRETLGGRFPALAVGRATRRDWSPTRLTAQWTHWSLPQEPPASEPALAQAALLGWDERGPGGRSTGHRAALSGAWLCVKVVPSSMWPFACGSVFPAGGVLAQTSWRPFKVSHWLRPSCQFSARESLPEQLPLGAELFARKTCHPSWKGLPATHHPPPAPARPPRHGQPTQATSTPAPPTHANHFARSWAPESILFARFPNFL